MDRFFVYLRKTLVATIALVFAFVVTYTPQQYNQIHPAEAQFAVTDVGPSGAANINTAAQTTLAAVKETSLDQIGFLLAKTMLSQILQSLVTWINSGFKGSPAFIQDIERFLLDVADETAGEYIQGLGDIGSFICSPFRLDIQLALALKYQKSRENRRDSCTLSGVVDNVENFFSNQVDRKDFWKQWVEITSKPEIYTPYGQLITAEGELNARIANARGQEIQIANWGNGFLSNEVCEAIEGPSGAGQRCVISTPGRVIAEQLTVTLDSGRQQLVAADEINEVISALLGQIANQAITGAAGLLGLSAGTGFTSGGFGAGSYVDELARESFGSTGSFLGDSYEQTVEKLEVQEDFNEEAVKYIPELREVIEASVFDRRFNGLTSNEITELKSRARNSLDDALEVQSETTRHIEFLRPILTSFVALQKEYAAVETTAERKQAIITEQTQIIINATRYPAYTIDALRVSTREWRSITRS